MAGLSLCAPGWVEPVAAAKAVFSELSLKLGACNAAAIGAGELPPVVVFGNGGGTVNVDVAVLPSGGTTPSMVVVGVRGGCGPMVVGGCVLTVTGKVSGCAVVSTLVSVLFGLCRGELWRFLPLPVGVPPDRSPAGVPVRTGRPNTPGVNSTGPPSTSDEGTPRPTTYVT